MVQIETSWLKRLEPALASLRMQALNKFLNSESQNGKIIFPNEAERFAALNETPWSQVRVVILGQDPYHGPGQAHGLAFSVKDGVRFPPSLLNIYKELRSDLGIDPPTLGSLLPWARQGVLLLNSVLTVESGKAASHQGQGWEEFTDQIVHLLNDDKEGLVFVLWGSSAQQKGKFIDRNKHLVLESPHPSPLSAHRGFLGSRPFSKINAYLASRGSSPIQWG
jgi:uracil-DNA glycosylase